MGWWPRHRDAVVDPMVTQVLSAVLGPQTSMADARRRTFLAVPSSASPRLLVRTDARPLGARGATRLLVERSARAGVRRLGLVVALATGVGSLVPGRTVRWSSSPAGGEVLAWLEELLGEPVDVAAVRLGPPRANRKPVIQVSGRGGREVCWVKLANSSLTVRLLERERVALSALTGRTHELHIPTPLGSRRWADDWHALVTAPLPELAPTSIRREVVLQTVRAVHHTAAAAPPAASAAPLPDLVANPRLGGLASLAAAVQAEREGLQLGAWHGDLHVGNFAVARDGLPVLWDWERWETGVPLGADLLHHDLQSAISDGLALRSAAEMVVDRAPQLLGALGVPAAAAPFVAHDYLIRLAARYVQDRPNPASGSVGDVEAWILPVLGVAASRR